MSETSRSNIGLLGLAVMGQACRVRRGTTECSPSDSSEDVERRVQRLVVGP